MKRAAGFLLAAAILVTLAACGKKDGKNEEIAFQSSAVYRLEDIALPIDTGRLWGSCTDGKNLYFVISEKDRDKERYTLFRTDWETGEITQIGGLPPGGRGRGNTCAGGRGFGYSF